MKGKMWEFKYCLFLLVVPCVLVLLVAFFWFQNALGNIINQTNYEIMQETARQQLLSFETKIQGQLNQLQLYERSFNNIDMNDYNTVKDFLNVTEGAGSFQTIFLAYSNGKLVSNHNTLVGNIMKEPYFQEAMAGNAAVAINAPAGEDDASQLIFAVPIYQKDTVVGVLAGSEWLTEENEFVLANSFGGLGATFIVDKDGEILLQSDNNVDAIFDASNNPDSQSSEKISDGKDMFDQTETYLTNNNTEIYRCRTKEEEYIMIREPVAYNDWSLVLQVNASFVNSQSTQILIYVLKLLFLVLISMLVIVTALFQLRSYSDRLKDKAERDLLTNLLNKKTFERRVENIISNHSADETGSLLIIDLDNFKGINDKLGHMTGDRVLSCVADKMREAFRSQDYLGRIGGDEFAVYFTFQNKSSIEERRAVIQSRAEHFCTIIKQITDETTQNTKISCSIGIAMEPEHGTDYSKLYQSADRALYQAKEAGKNQYRILT